MEVLKNNFRELLPAIKDAIDSCDFLAIDTELTGLYSSRTTEHAFDTMEERYSKLRELCSKFLIIQFGVSTFKYHPKLKKYTHRDFNFYVFPRPLIRQAPDPRFLCQTSSLHFLASHGFDFNKVIYEGIPYLTLAHEEKVKDYLDSKYKTERNSLVAPKTNNDQKVIDIPDEHKDFIAEIQEKVDAFISNDSETVIHLQPCSAYRRKLIYDSVQAKHTSGIEMSSKMNEDNERFITIMKCTEQDKLDKLESQENCDLDDVDCTVGFRKVMDHISSSKKLVIGHNMYLDIVHSIEQFFLPLPEDLREFKSMCRMIFPRLIDTKCLASSEKLKPFVDSTGLSHIFKAVHGKAFELPTIEAEDGFKGYDLKTEHSHEAGYDAMMTGISFIGLAKKLASLSNPKVEYVDPSHKSLSPFVNRFHIMRHFDISCVNLSGPDPEPNRDNVFYVSFPQEWKTVDLVELFLPYGNIYVNWLDDVSALVALKQVENTISAKTNLVNKTSRLYRVKSYADYQKWCNQQSKSEQDRNKKSCQSSDNKPQAAKRRNSASEDGCSMDLIPEVDENEAETTDNSDLPPPSKKLKPIEEENEASVVSSTARVFEEENNW